MKIIIDKKKCSGCGTCKIECPKGGKIWSINRRSGKAKPSNLEFCHLCTICASKCPEYAIKIIRDDNYGKKEEKNGEENLRD
ncbi:MAG: ferredoxin family protein [Euryarchaeota archaeon]|nr:ferredoxin family protein [Euryarchaeota archaeon]